MKSFFRTWKLNKKQGKATIDHKKVAMELTKAAEVSKPIIPRLNIKPENLLLTFGSGQINVFYSSLLTLEMNFGKDEYKPRAQIGWISDEIIDAYLYQLRRKYPKMIYVGCTEAMMLTRSSKDQSLRLLWSKDDLCNFELIVIPHNESQVYIEIM